jgi:hypothetical protein
MTAQRCLIAVSGPYSAWRPVGQPFSPWTLSTLCNTPHGHCQVSRSTSANIATLPIKGAARLQVPPGLHNWSDWCSSLDASTTAVPANTALAACAITTSTAQRQPGHTAPSSVAVTLREWQTRPVVCTSALSTVLCRPSRFAKMWHGSRPLCCNSQHDSSGGQVWHISPLKSTARVPRQICMQMQPYAVGSSSGAAQGLPECLQAATRISIGSLPRCHALCCCSPDEARHVAARGGLAGGGQCFGC